MEKCEFSETQFVIGYTRELFNSIYGPHKVFLPSPFLEQWYAADLIIYHYSRKNKFRYSVYYQFKRSKYYNRKNFSSLKGGHKIDTQYTPMHSFNIYNSKKTKQFNILQKLAKERRKKVYYCAPLFHTIQDFNVNYSNLQIKANSMLFDMSQDEIQNIRIPLDSKHIFLFDKNEQFICSDPVKIKGTIADNYEKTNLFDDDPISFEDAINNDIESVTQIIKKQELDWKLPDITPDPFINYFVMRDWLLNIFNIYWHPIFESEKNVS